MISHTTRRFRDALARLPKDIQRQAKKAFALFRDDPSHPGIRFKKVHATEPIY